MAAGFPKCPQLNLRLRPTRKLPALAHAHAQFLVPSRRAIWMNSQASPNGASEGASKAPRSVPTRAPPRATMRRTKMAVERRRCGAETKSQRGSAPRGLGAEASETAAGDVVFAMAAAIGIRGGMGRLNTALNKKQRKGPGTLWEIFYTGPYPAIGVLAPMTPGKELQKSTLFPKLINQIQYQVGRMPWTWLVHMHTCPLRCF